MRVLFVPTYRHPAGAARATASDALGFGVTCCDALVAGLRDHGLAVDVVASSARRQTVWVGETLERFEQSVRRDAHDVVLAFHAFWPFTADLRRILDEGGSRPLVTYTHGSHWDRTDTFRAERYPRLRWADLGNLMAADRVLVVSDHLREVLLREVGSVSAQAAVELGGKLRTVGLPLDLARIDAARDGALPGPGGPRPRRIVFNHAPIPAKQPGVFLDLVAEVLARTDTSVLVTRHFPAGSRWGRQLASLAAAFPGRVIRGDDLSTDRYYAELWASQIQVSTAIHESLGVATLEAMATGNHCLLPRVGAYPEVVGGDSAVLYDDLADLLARLLDTMTVPDPATAARHRDRVRRRYSPRAVAGAVHRVLAEAVEEHPRGPGRPR
ncbi:MAG: hypothetical protein IRZ08_18440 [Frankia sp.]|nr:hypothetical protein [Frankia sp.]